MIMKRYILTLSTLLILIVGLSVSLVIFFQPKPQNTITFDRLYPTQIHYRNFERYVDKVDRAYFFCSLDSINCQYVYQDILVPLMNVAGTERFEQIFFVNADILKQDILPSAIKNRLGFEEMPAFVILRKEQNRIVYRNVYAWSDSNPMTLNQLKLWMIDNNLWLESYQD